MRNYSKTTLKLLFELVSKLLQNYSKTIHFFLAFDQFLNFPSNIGRILFLVVKSEQVSHIATSIGGLGELMLVVVSVCIILCWEGGGGLLGEGWLGSVPGESHSSNPRAGATSHGGAQTPPHLDRRA